MNPFIRIFSSRVVFRTLLLGITAGVSLLASDREKYLAAAGPTPIRLLMETTRLDPMKALPRLRMSDAVEPVKPAEPLQTAAREAIVNSVGSRDKAPGTSHELTPTQPLPLTTNNETSQEPPAQVSPQMLLRYFSRNGTNEVLVPYSVDFTPPVPRRSGDSKAVYISE